MASPDGDVPLSRPVRRGGTPAIVVPAAEPPTTRKLDGVQDLEDDILNPAFGVPVAERDGRVVGVFFVAPIELSSTHAGVARRDDAQLLAWAATRPEVQGSGAGLDLTNAAFACAREEGCRVIVVDWRETNLSASRFWPARGFRPTFLRLYRSIP